MGSAKPAYHASTAADRTLGLRPILGAKGSSSPPRPPLGRKGWGANLALVGTALLFWLALGTMVMPTAAGVGIAGSSASHVPTLAQTLPLPLAGVHSVASTSLPSHPTASASNSPSSTSIDGVAFAKQQIQHALSVGMAFVPPTTAAPKSYGPVHPNSPISTGYFSGYVNATHGSGLGSVSVQAYSTGGALCPATTCLPGVTNSQGSYFNLVCPTGAGYVQATIGGYLSNLTYATCVKGLTTYIGTMYLVKVAWVNGTIQGDTPQHEKVTGVAVKGTSRDGSITASPAGSSDNFGRFTVAVPPMPSRIDFTPPYGYLANFTYVNATPGEYVNIGTIFLERQTIVRAELYDSANLRPVNIGGGGGASLTVCGALSSTCGIQGLTIGSGFTVSAFGPPGVDYVVVQATGYVEDKHMVGFVPKESPGHVFDVGHIYLVPDGAISLNVSLGMTRTQAQQYPWGVGMYVVTVRSLDGYAAIGLKLNPVTGGINTTSASPTAIEGCGTPGTSKGVITAFASVPLRVEVQIKPDTAGSCAPFPTWPIPGLAPVWDNTTLLNVTPNTITGGRMGVWLNLTPGTYVEGNISATNHTQLNDYHVLQVSQTNPNQDQYSYTWCGSTCPATSPWLCSGGAREIPAPTDAVHHTFCVPAPPGPDIFQGSSQSFPGYLNNFTWGGTAAVCCNRSQTPGPLNVLNTEHFNWINLTSQGRTFGHVYMYNTSLGVAFGSYKICTAGLNTNLFCTSGAINNDGSVWSPAPLGWDQVTASASGFSPNSVWVYVSGNVSFGNITLTPLGTISGQVVNAAGQGIYEAGVFACPLAAPQPCTTAIGAGLTTTDGHYNGTLLGGWLPWATYYIQATASGYSSDFVWVNVSTGGYVHVPTIVLHTLGTNQSIVQRQSAAGTISTVVAGVWIDGTVVDNATGWGVQPSSLTVTPATGGANPIGLSNGTNQGGYFNDSIPSGVYYLTGSAAGYYTFNISFNASGRSFIHLGTIRILPYPWVSGNMVMDPWAHVVVPITQTTFSNITMVPGSIAAGCDHTSLNCGVPGSVDSLGYYNVSIPYGTGDIVRASGLFSGGGPSAPGGYIINRTRLNVTAPTLWVDIRNDPPIAVEMFATLTGSVWDNSTYNVTTGLPQLPARWASVSVLTTGNNTGAGVVSTGGGGGWAFLLPPGNRANYTFTSASLTGVFYTKSYTVPRVLVAAGLVDTPPMWLNRWGWVESVVVDRTTHLPAAYIPVTANFNDPRNGTSQLGSALSNGGGFVNLSSPVGKKIVVTAGPANDYNISGNVTVAVNQSMTTWANVSVPNGAGNLSVDSWGWVRSVAVNNTNPPVEAGVIDSVNRLPVPFASIKVCSSDPLIGCGNVVQTNWMGQFVTDAPISAKASMQITRGGYFALSQNLRVLPAQTVVVQSINASGVNLTLVGNGVLAGRVIAFPSGTPVSGAVVTVCPHGVNGTACYTVSANQSGVFWVLSPPIAVDISVSALGYVSNISIARPCSDCWDWVGALTINEYSYVSGTVRGLPSGTPIQGATVSACSTLGVPVGACGFSVQTASSGHFLLAVPANTYILQTNDTNFNTSYQPISLRPGQHVDLGTVFLNQFGWLVGTVFSATTFSPVRGATIYTCPTWAGGTCSPPTITDSGGHFFTAGAPGPYIVTASAPGYSDTYVHAKIISGVTTTLPSILVYPLGTSLAYPVSGRVVNYSNPSQGLVGAVVAALVNGTPAVSSTTDSNGVFKMNVLWGTYNLSVVEAGYHPDLLPLIVQGPVSGLVIQLSVMTYNVTGVVSDALNHQPLAGVEISQNGLNLGVTDASGTYQISLANGSVPLAAIYLGGGPVAYPTVMFVLSINGASQVHNLAMSPPMTSLYGLVVDSYNGVGLAGASVTVTGKALDGVPISLTATSDASGHFALQLPQGTYTGSASFGGYVTTGGAIPASTPQTQLTIGLVPEGHPSTAALSGNIGLITLLAVLGIVLGAVVLVAVLATRRANRGPVTKQTRTVIVRAKPPEGPGGSR